MDKQLIILFALTFVIHLIATLAYSVRIAGTRTGKIALSLALFNILVLVSRTSNSFQAPLLAKRVEYNLLHGVTNGAAWDFRLLLLAATLATLTGALLIPTFQRLFGRAVAAFSIYRSVPQLLVHGLSKAGAAQARRAVTVPVKENVTRLHAKRRLSGRILLFNVAATAISTVGVFASLYAGYLNPHLRVTASSLSAVINGTATIFLAIFIDPYLSVLTDDVMEGRASEAFFRRAVVWLVGSRFVGTILAQALLWPSALLISALATRL